MPADSHCHLNNPSFTDDVDEVARKVEDAGFVRLLNVGYDIPTSIKAIELAEKYPYMLAAVGVHPHHASDVNSIVIDELRKMARHPKVVAIGETGLDYFRDRSPRDDQKQAFAEQVKLAKEFKKPVIIHTRDAMDDTKQMVDELAIGENGGIMHCFAGTPEDVRFFLAHNFYISFAGNITYPKATGLRDALKTVPGHRLLLETDAPYLSPQKVRGKRNDPLNLSYTIDTAAEVRGVTRADIERIIVTNFEELFGLYKNGAGEVAYRIRNSLYLNVTMGCTNECYFCARYHSNTVQGHNLRLQKDPTADEMIAAIGDPTQYDEIVFCGYGEPTLRLDRIVEVARAVKAKGGTTRLNTNGHGSHIAGRDIAGDLKGVIDHMSVSLNSADEATYNEICKPQIKNGWKTTVEFIKSAKSAGLDVTATVVAIPNKVDVTAVKEFAEQKLGVNFRVRKFNLVG
ncbi:Uncharacterized metal-dependent hydrolase YcfH [hydrothermal vent metagenome]|uniref:Uncharacterized metal-dependent hydrolase YcfH n=1 Tax=hydrothermal vent metagenome TaxID=652676 RepID=A0A3B1BUK9_9ZZZZ